MSGILVRRNNSNLLTTSEPGEILYAFDTNKWGLGTSNGIIWRNHTLEPNFFYKSNGVPPADFGILGEYYFDLGSNVIYQKNSSGWEEASFPISKGEIDAGFLRKNLVDHSDLSDLSEIIRDDGSVTARIDYEPHDGLDALTVSWTEKYLQILRVNGSTPMSDTYVQHGNGVAILGSGIYAPPLIDPRIDGVIWNNNGVPEMSAGPIRLGHVRYYTTSSMGFSDGTTRTPQNGYIDIITDDEVHPTSNQDTVTKGEILAYGLRVGYYNLFFGCINMTEMIISAPDQCNVIHMNGAWSSCSSLTSFPQIDASKGTRFDHAWYGCSSLPSCPGTDGTVNIPAGADTTDMCYGI